MMNFFHREILQTWAKRILIAFCIFYILGIVLWSWPRQPTCPVEEHSFQGRKLDIEICNGYTSDYHGHIGILVYSKEGRFLAWRQGTFARQGSLNYMTIEDDKIRYSDSPMDRINPPADCVLNMPPTWVDWLEARLPGGIPGVNHCGTASEDVVDKAQAKWAIREEAARQKNEQAVRDNNARQQGARPEQAASE
jgi:hypothetical protein